MTLGERELSVGLDVGNVFDIPYFNYVNRYRLTNLPEQGRNVTLRAELPIEL